MKFSRMYWIGVTITLSVAVFFFGLLYLQDVSLNQPKIKFTIMFENVQGLNVGDHVSMLGKRIGKVSASKIIGNKIAVEVSINSDFSFSIPIDSKIEVRSEGLLGSKFIAIEPGLDTKNSVNDGDIVQGIREFDFTEITPGIVPITQDLGVFARKLKALLGDEEKERIRSTIENIESMTNELDQFVKNYKDIINDSDKEQISQFTQNLNSASKVLESGIELNMDKLRSILDDIESVSSKSEQIQKIIDNTDIGSKNFSSSMQKFDVLLSDVNSGEGSLGKIVKDEALFENANLLILEARSVVKDFKDNPSKYLKAYFRAKKSH